MKTFQDLLRALLACAVLAMGLHSESKAHYQCTDRWGHHYMVSQMPYDDVDGVACAPIPQPMVIEAGTARSRVQAPTPAAREPRALPPVAAVATPPVAVVPAAPVASVAPVAPVAPVAATPAPRPVAQATVLRPEAGPRRKAPSESEMAGIFGFPLQGSANEDRISGLNPRP